VVQRTQPGAWSYTADVVGCLPKEPCFERLIVSNTVAALDLWTRHLAGGAAIEVEIEVGYSVERAAGSSLTSGFVRHEGGVEVYEQGVAHEIRTGRGTRTTRRRICASCSIKTAWSAR